MDLGFTTMISNFFQNRKKRNFIFVHINKIGGMSVEKVLGLEKQHITALEYRKTMSQKKWDKAFKFSFVRNPWDKVVSHYFHRIKTNQTGLGINPIVFKEWVKLTYGDQNPKYYDNPKYFMPQLDWLTNSTGEIIVDYIGRFENLEQNFQLICESIGVTVELPHVNKSKHKQYYHYYDDETKEIVRLWFEKDIKMFNYNFLQ